MLWRALFAFLVLPGIVAFAVPLVLIAERIDTFNPRPLGLLSLFAGVIVLVWCTVVFYVSGRGTLAPWSPPQQLVAVGPYRFSRNPMYVGVTLILSGWAVLFWSLTLMVYCALVLLAFHIRVIVAEEPWLKRTFGADWESYRARVPRWLF
jgi:protein-S-isoprenylcysteine O-methyltransferase Ste14